MTTASELPIHLAGNNAPVAGECDAVPARVVGTIPAELEGTYVRNGPNPRTGWSPHLFAGDGMVHAISLRGGQAVSYRNRYVRTPLYEHPGAERFDLAFDPATREIDYRVTTANTHVVEHAGRLLALEEGGFPYQLTRALETVGPFTFGGRLQTPMTAHPKTCPTTGELLFFGYQLRRPFVTCHRASAEGDLLSSEPITVSRATMMHDFAITATKLILWDSPVVFDARAVAAGGPPWRWDDDHGARIGVMPRTGTDGDVRWFDIEPAHLSHAVNAWEDGDRISITGCRIASMWRGGSTDMSGDLPRLHGWAIDLGNGTVSEGALDDAASDYPRVADACVGLPNRFAYTAAFMLEASPDHGEIHKYDMQQGARRTTHTFARGHTCGEPVFVPGSGPTSEDDGYLLTLAHDRSLGTSYLAVLDAADVSAPPVAEVHLPVRVPGGFHGTWVPDR